jgi:protein-S-isoprenylcysteine O-methyltransferase Ste14
VRFSEGDKAFKFVAYFSIVVIAYLLIIVELVFFPIPSEVSTVAILSRKKRSDYPHRGKKQKLSQMVYLAYVVVSSIVVLCIFCIPIAWVFWSPLIAIAAGSFISFWAVIELHAFIGTNPTRNRLKTNGIYSGSRNPITLGNSIIYIGFVFTVPTWVMIVGFIIYCFHIDHKIKMEEKNLESKFGSTFRDYKKKVGRYLR